METTTLNKQGNTLIFLGLLLFLLALIIGLFVQNMTNPRMALSAHLEGIMNGMFLMILGLVWRRLILSKTLFKTTYLLVIYGTFANLTANMIAAFTGFGKMLPMAGGKEGAGIAEDVISFLLISLGLCMIAVCIIVWTGVYRLMKQSPTE